MPDFLLLFAVKSIFVNRYFAVFFFVILNADLCEVLKLSIERAFIMFGDVSYF